MTLSLRQLENNWAALGHAERLKLRPTIPLDISFGVGDLLLPDDNAGTALSLFLKLARQWIEKRGGQTAYIYAIENRYSGVGETGLHAHVLIHVPTNLRERFHSLKRVWARKVGLTYKPGLFGPIGKRRKPISTLEGVKGKLCYMCKDGHPDALAIFKPFINPRTDKPWLHDSGKPSTGPVYGLKTGVSRNINDKARRSYRHTRSEHPR